MFANIPWSFSAGIPEKRSVHAGFRKATDQTPTRTVEASQVPKASRKRSASVIVRRNSLMQLPEFTRSTRCAGPSWWPAYLGILSWRYSDLFT
jgi:hypothetical protein